MAAGTAINAYQNSYYEGMDPKNLILMLYNGALKHLQLTKEGIIEKDIQKRGENLGRTIAIISELNASLDPNIKDEAIEFLRGLYNAMLLELPRVSITNDLKTIELSNAYIEGLRDIWKVNVMGIADKKSNQNNENALNQQVGDTVPSVKTRASYNKLSGYANQPSIAGNRSFSA